MDRNCDYCWHAPQNKWKRAASVIVQLKFKNICYRASNQEAEALSLAIALGAFVAYFGM